MVDIVTRLGKGSPLTNAEVDANFTNLAEVSGVTGEPMGHEDRTTSTISFNASTRTFTIAPVASSFTVWCKGKKVVVSTAQTVTIPNTTGMYSIYYDANGVLSAKSGYFTFSLEAPTAYVYWNAATGTAPYFGDERHGVVLDWQTHEYLHRTRGAALASGFSASGYVLGGNGSSNSHAQITLEGGTFFDEDMKIIVTATNTPTAGTWEQDLLSPARIPVLYLSGTGWVIDAPTDYPLKQGTARPQYNAYSGGVWSTADVANNKYATSWILATNNLTYPVIAIIGQAENDLQSAAEAVDFTALQLPGFPSVEFRPLYKLIFQCADSCTNAVHASLVSITDIRSIAAAGTAASIVTDHGNLSGLSDDDHPQYIHVDTLRTVSAAVKASFLPSQTSNAGKFLQTDGTATSWQALTSGNVTTALGFTPYNATNPSGYITGISSSDVTTALGFTPYNATNPSGYVTAAGARGAISVTGAGSYDSATGVINIVGGVTSFNTRTGAITLSSADVTTALGFTPYNNTNPSGYITGITSTMVTTALGFTPYNSSNPNGYISSITSANVTTALGFTPYNATNPSGYITSSALSGYLTSASAASTYLPLSGGTVTGQVISSANGNQLRFVRADGTTPNWTFHSWGGGLNIYSSAASTVYIGRDGPGTNLDVYNGSLTQAGNQVLHAGNYNSYAPTLTGGGASGTWSINVTGNAGSATTAAKSSATTVPASTAFTKWLFATNSTSGTQDWNHVSNTRPGVGEVLLLGNHANGPGGGNYYHPLNFEYSSIEGSGNVTQLAIAYGSPGNELYMRGSYSGSWNGWNRFLNSNNYSSYALPISGGSLTGALSAVSGLRSYYSDHIAGDGYGIRFWESNAYKISMGASSLYQYGTVTDYSIKMQMDNGSPGRGFTWGRESYAPIASLNATSGNFQTAGQMYVQGAQIASGAFTVRAGGAGGVGWGTGLNIGDSSNYSGFIQDAGISRWRNTGSGGYDWFNSATTQIMALSNSGYLGVGQASDASYRIIASGHIYANANGNVYAEGRHYSRHGTGTFYESLTTGNYSSYALPLSGGSLSGSLTINNSSPTIYLQDTDNRSAMIHVNSNTFYVLRGSGTNSGSWSTYNGYWPLELNLENNNATFGGSISSVGNTVLHAGNFSSYSHSIATSDSRYSRKDTTSQWIKPYYEYGSYLTSETPSTLKDQMGGGGLRVDFMNPSYTGSGGWNHVITWSGYNMYNMYQLGGHYDGGTGTDLWVRSEANHGGTSWTAWRRILNSSNYNSYSPTLTGGGASGTWNITASNLASDTSTRFKVITFTGEGYDSGNGSVPTSYGIYQQGGGWSHPYPDLCIGFHTGIKIGAYFGYNGTRFYNNSDWATEIFSVGNGDNNVRVTDTLFVGGNTALHAGNYSSYAGGLSTGNNWTNYNYFVANRNTTSDSPPLQAFSNNGSGAIMSFHRGGYYAVNFGLDSDNVMRIGGWSAAANRWQLDMSGNMTVAGNVTAYSDERLKKDWAALPSDFVERLAKIKAGTYTRIDSEERQAGVSAQDWQKLLPETVSTDNEGTLSLAYGNAALVSAVELAKEVVDLRTRVAQLESLINKLIGD